MYAEDSVKRMDIPVKQPEVFKVIQNIKDELFNIREQLGPVLTTSDKSSGLQSPTQTHLMQEVQSVLEIVIALREDISL